MEENQIDFYSDEIQNELDVFTRKFLPFQPDAIAIEAPFNSQSDIDRAYKKFNLSDLRNKSKMETETLGEIFVYNNTRSIVYKNEAIQIGFRLAKMLNHIKIHAIDDDTILNTEVLTHASSQLNNAIGKLLAYENEHKGKSIAELYECYNSVEWSRINHNCYMKANLISTENQYAGAEMVSKWYDRNLKIFSNIQKLAINHKRIFIIYGAGHLQILKDLIKADSDLELVDANEYL